MLVFATMRVTVWAKGVGVGVPLSDCVQKRECVCECARDRVCACVLELLPN